MPRLCVGFDMDQFLNHCRMTKPPYECPHVSCGRTYRSYAGIQQHMTNFDHENPPPNGGIHKSGSVIEPEPIPIPMSTDLKMVEFELDGKLSNLSVYEPIEIMSREHYEASMPPVVEDPPVQEQAKTPITKLNSKHLTPKTPKNRSVDKDRGVDVQRYTIEEKKSQKLPEAVFKIIPDYYKNIPDIPKQTDEYFNFIEKSLEELDEEIEYDMDEEDRAWLEIINDRRRNESLDTVSMEHFELLMDRLEKESFFQAQSTGRDTGAPIDEDAVCCICMDGECQNSNVILFCDMCNLAVHQECYGVPYIPEGQWLCRRCLQSPSRAVDCALCPNKGGAFKQTDDSRWAHVVCAMWIPEVCFANTVFLEPIDSIGNIPPARWKLTCYICVQRGVGACIQCNKVNCYTAFHVTCAQQAGLHMKIDAIRETSAVGTSVTVRKAAYCDMHTPADSDAVEEVMDAAKKAAAKAASRQKMKKARKILAEKRSAAPIVSVPILPADRIQHLATLVNIDKRSQFIHRLLAYWTLKRQSRNGVPLLRRLTSSYARRGAINNSSGSITNLSPSPKSPLSPKMKKKREKKQKIKEEENVDSVNEENKLREEIKHWQHLRQDLERARLLCELIRKREKIKRELIKAKADERFVQLSPFVHLLLQKIDQLQEKDIQQIFAEPVDFEEVPDYLDVVKHPMDLSTMRQKAQAHQYQNVQQFASDFELMIDNCLIYNSRDTVFYRAAVKLRDVGGAIIRQLSRDIENIGFDPGTGVLLPQRPKPPPELSDQNIIKEVDEYLALESHEDESWEERKNKLFDLLDKVNLLKHPVSRIKKVKLIRREIGIVRRKLSLNESGATSPGGKAADHFSDSDERSDKEDTDDSSIIDDEAEPGVPSRTTSPVSVVPSTPSAGNYSSQGKQSSQARPVGLSLTPKTPTGTRSLRAQGHDPSNHTPTTSGNKKGINRAVNNDVKQRKIDVFFTKVEPETPPMNKKRETVKSEDDKKVEPKEQNESNKENKTKKQGRMQAEKQDPKKSCSSFLGDTRKRGRPSRGSASAGHDFVHDNVLDESVEIEEVEEIEMKSPKPPVGNSVEEEEEPDVEVLLEKEKGEGKEEETPPSQEENTQVDESCEKCEEREENEEPPNETADQPREPLVIVDLGNSSALTMDSFKNYRQGGEISQETDDDTHSSDSNSTLTDSEDESGSDSNSDEGDSDSDSSGAMDHSSVSGGGQSVDQIPLEPLDLVWAKCRGYPWYPALIINPKMPRTGYFHNHVPIPVPPDEVLAHASNYQTPMYLVLFFDQKRTWQWLPRNKLEPLGENSSLDKAKLVESRKPTDRKAVKKAYEKAILHRCRVTGENTGLSGESDPEEIPT